MEAVVRKIGNSRGVIIPSAILAACDIQDRVIVEMSGKTLVMHAPTQQRKDWYTGFAESKNEHLAAIQWETMNEETGDWEW